MLISLRTANVYLLGAFTLLLTSCGFTSSPPSNSLHLSSTDTLDSVSVTSSDGLLLADRGGSNLMLSQNFTQSTRSEGLSKDLLIVGQGTEKRETYLFDRNHKELGTIPAISGNYAVSSQGTLYDSPYRNSNLLLIFEPPYQKQTAQISLKNNIVKAVAVDVQTGVFAVGLQGHGPNSTFSVEFFEPGSTTSCATVETPVQYIFGLAFDREGRLFFLNAFPEIDSIAGQCHATTMESYSLPTNTRRYPLPPLFFNTNDDLVFEDADSRAVLTYRHPINGQFAAPIFTTNLKLPEKDVNYARQLLCLGADGNTLWASYSTGSDPSLTLSQFHYPQGGEAIVNIPFKDADSAAISPPLIP